MRLALGKALILLAIGLVLANAQCFSRCLVTPCQAGQSPCHHSGKTAMQCSHAQDLITASQQVDLSLDCGEPVSLTGGMMIAQSVEAPAAPLPLAEPPPKISPLRI